MSEQDPSRRRTVTTDIAFHVHTPSSFALQVRPATSSGRICTEELRIEREDGSVAATSRPVAAENGGRIDLFDLTPGRVSISYYAELEVPDVIVAPVAADPAYEQLVLQRPSRYCPSDHVVGFASAEFGAAPSPGDQVRAIASWIFERIRYVAGTSGVHDSAEHTLLTGQGVCRDFAHLGIVLCRALNIPARFAAVYAPGLDPMDFHAVFEAWHDGAWWAYDSTRKAPRATLVRVATGRDAADAPFASVTSGIADLLLLTVSATSGANLPHDQHDALIALA